MASQVLSPDTRPDANEELAVQEPARRVRRTAKGLTEGERGKFGQLFGSPELELQAGSGVKLEYHDRP